MTRPFLSLGVLVLFASLSLARAEWADLGNDRLESYFASRVQELERPLAPIVTAEDWTKAAPRFRRQLRDMLGLDPLPPRTPLEATVTGSLEQKDFRVENLHFQSRPGLYVTANLYLPKGTEDPVPGILYVCGHGRVKLDGVSYGNKVNYHHHGVWFAHNGYACLVIDTLQLGEIEGIHHGTYRHGRWWWNARGYTPAGVEAWNGIRALDYLQNRPEVDPDRLGVTGRSGGGAYSWWVATLDDRIHTAVPVAGIASLHNHVVDGCIEGHCDCMFPVNTYRWDFEKVAALVAPRPLLISNTDKDRIFPLDGVYQVYRGTRTIYELLDARGRIGLHIEEGPHKDTQPLRTSAFHWMNRHLRGAPLTDTFEMAATKVFEPSQLKVFSELPEDERNTTIDETFVPRAQPPEVPESTAQWEEWSDSWRQGLAERSFRGWPESDARVRLRETFTGVEKELRLTAYEVTTEPDVVASLYVVHRADSELAELDLLVLNALAEPDWHDFLGHVPSLFPEAFPEIDRPEVNRDQLEAERRMYRNFNWGMAYFCPRGVGPDVWPENERKRTHIRRRFALLGQTIDGMRTWDVLQAIRGIRRLGFGDRPLWLQARGAMAGNALYASLFVEKPVNRLDLHRLPSSHREGPIYLNVLRVWDLPQALTLAAGRSKVRLYTGTPKAWSYVTKTAGALNWPEDRVQIREPVE